MIKKVIFRADASIDIGTGHVMRCLTLAEALASRGTKCTFICRSHKGNLIEHIQDRGFATFSLPPETEADTDLAHSAWLGATQAQDSRACMPFLLAEKPDWLVVDHYALDARWEVELSKQCGQLMVIDDLADRPHHCQTLLDQTFGRASADYRALVPNGCRLLCGSNYALLRPEFAALRPYSLNRRAKPKLQNLLIAMGGIDKHNLTTLALEAVRGSTLPENCEITVVMGSTAPWLSEVERSAGSLRWRTTVRVGVNNMANLMADSDLAIGGAGATTWERCCLGLPSITIVLAENQLQIAKILEKGGSAAVLTPSLHLSSQICALLSSFASNPLEMRTMSKLSSAIVDGEGARLVSALMESPYA